MARLLRHLVGELRRRVGPHLRAAVHRLSIREARELAQRDQQRPPDGGRWLTDDERKLIDVLASLIVPADGAGPGARDAGVTETLDRMLARSSGRRTLYARGLLSLDEWARRRHGGAFTALPIAEQLDLLHEAEGHRGVTGGPLALRPLKRLYDRWRWPVIDFFPVLVQDVFQAFYTSSVAWRWLGYDGPPMPQGYPELMAPRPVATE